MASVRREKEKMLMHPRMQFFFPSMEALELVGVVGGGKSYNNLTVISIFFCPMRVLLHLLFLEWEWMRTEWLAVVFSYTHTNPFISLFFFFFYTTTTSRGEREGGEGDTSR